MADVRMEYLLPTIAHALGGVEAEMIRSREGKRPSSKDLSCLSTFVSIADHSRSRYFPLMPLTHTPREPRPGKQR